MAVENNECTLLWRNSKHTWLLTNHCNVRNLPVIRIVTTLALEPALLTKHTNSKHSHTSKNVVICHSRVDAPTNLRCETMDIAGLQSMLTHDQPTIKDKRVE